MSKVEEIYGKIMASVIVLLAILSFLFSAFNVIFYNKDSIGLYGNRGNSYIYDDYDIY